MAFLKSAVRARAAQIPTFTRVSTEVRPSPSVRPAVSELDVVEGMQFDRGYISPYFVTDQERMVTEFDNARVLITDKKISSIQDLVSVLERVARDGAPLLIIAEDIEGEALATLVVNKARGVLNVAAIKAPSFGDHRKAMLQDIAVLTGGQVISEEVGLSLDTADLSMLGTATKATITKDTTTLVSDAGNKADIDKHIAQIRQELDRTDSDYDKEKLSERLAKLAGGVAVIKVGAATESESSPPAMVKPAVVSDHRQVVVQPAVKVPNSLLLAAVVRFLRWKWSLELYPPVSNSLLAAAVVRDHHSLVPIKNNTNVNIDHMRLINVDLAHLVGKVQVPTEGMPRQQMTVPISPTPDITDEVVFEHATGPQRYFVPRYSLAIANSQYQIDLEPSGSDWSLVVYLDRFAAPAIQPLVVDGQALTHEIAVVLTHNLLAGTAVVGRKELVFQEVTAAGDRLQAALRVSGLPERDQIYHALTDSIYGAALMVRRILTVGIPVPQAQVVASGNSTIRATRAFNFDTGVEGGEGDVLWELKTATDRMMTPRGKAAIVSLGMVDFDQVSLSQLQGLNYSWNSILGNVMGQNLLPPGQVFAVRTNQGHYAKVKVLTYGPGGYNLTVQWVTYSTDAQSAQSRFREAIRTLDCAIAPSPFLFPPTLHGYVYSQLKAISGRSSDLKRITVNSHNYYQDRTKPNRFFTLPDSFKLARRPEIPHRPLVSVRVIPTEGQVLEGAQVILHYAALPYLNPARLEAATPELLTHVPADLRAQGLEFDRLKVDPSKTYLRVAKPGSRIDGPYQLRSRAVVDVKDGIADTLNLSLEEFQPIFDGMFSDATIMFGQVTVDLGDQGWRESSIPFVARMDDLIGEVFNYDRRPEVTEEHVSLSLQNCIESPVRVTALGVDLKQGDRPISVASLAPGVALPVLLNPGESLALTITPAEALGDGQPVEVAFDLSGVAVVPDREAIMQAIFDPTASVKPSRHITVETFAELFDLTNPILAIVVDFEHGTSARLTPSDLKTVVQVSLPMSAITDCMLRQPLPTDYRYRVTLIHRSGSQTRSDWHTDTTPYLIPLLP